MGKIKALSVLVAALLSSAATASTITFNELATNSSYVTFKSITSGGFVFTNSNNTSNALLIWGRTSPYQADLGNATVSTNYPSSITTMTSVGNTPFSLASIDLADVYNQGSSVTVKFGFNYFGGGSSSQSVTLDSRPGLQTFNFNQHNLTSVNWQTVSGNGWNQFDNINVAAVPEPETYGMLLAGLGVVGAVARRRRQQ